MNLKLIIQTVFVSLFFMSQSQKVFNQNRTPNIIPIKAGCNCYLICSNDGAVLIDAGSHHKLQAFDKVLAQNGLTWDTIKYIIITHTHYDHVANLAEIKKRSGAKVIIHKNESSFIESGITPLPEGMTFTGKIGICYTRHLGKHNVKVCPAAAEISVEDNYTIPGFGYRIIYNPGHSSGSISLILNDNICFCGDAAFAVLGNNLMPITGECKTGIVESWIKLLDTGCTIFYPGHGKPFTFKELQKSLQKYKKLLSQ
ncbi:MAG TPA: MBL fold metallo-hydrolase [Bacteroidales bacterium]|nr:MBL fold metallo-hydrolase [Bacteroidales bacterium]HQP04102.1 MBL fold metallo-hydrolase [Bacteroidales bacterium]